MDNLQFDITSEGEKMLGHALAVAFSRHSRATGWRTDERDGVPRLVLSWVPDAGGKGGWSPFLTPLEAEDAVGTVSRWLDSADYGPEPDHDGCNGKGWRIYCGPWGRVDPHGYEAFVAIEPCWAMYGK